MASFYNTICQNPISNMFFYVGGLEHRSRAKDRNYYNVMCTWRRSLSRMRNGVHVARLRLGMSRGRLIAVDVSTTPPVVY